MVKYFELDEVLHILVSVITISIAFTIVHTRSIIFDASFLQEAGIILLTVGAGFVLHELAHKFTAMHYGLYARYQAWTLGLVLAVVMAFAVGFVFAAPGAVYIYGNNVSREKNGKISMAGPLTNLVLGFLFLLLGFALPAFASIASLGASVNFFLGAFNLLPFFPMDGQKIYVWNKLYWAAIFVPMVILALVQIF